MKTAVIGLGLIGGSMAKAFKDNTDSEGELKLLLMELAGAR